MSRIEHNYNICNFSHSGKFYQNCDYENCEKLREIAIFVKFVAKWIFARFVAERAQRVDNCGILRKLQELQKLQFSSFS